MSRDVTELRERIASLEADIADYRRIVQRTLAALEYTTLQRDELRDQLRRMRDGESS